MPMSLAAAVLVLGVASEHDCHVEHNCPGDDHGLLQVQRQSTGWSLDPCEDDLGPAATAADRGGVVSGEDVQTPEDPNNAYWWYCKVGDEIKTTFAIYSDLTLTPKQLDIVQATWPGKSPSYYACKQGCEESYGVAGKCEKEGLNHRFDDHQVPEDPNNDYRWYCKVGDEIKTTFAIFSDLTLTPKQLDLVQTTWPGKPPSYYACKQGCEASYGAAGECEKKDPNHLFKEDPNNNYSWYCKVGEEKKTSFAIYSGLTLTPTQLDIVQRTWPGKSHSYYACKQGCEESYGAAGECEKQGLNHRFD